MRLLMTTDAIGGVWTYANDLAAGLAARGVEVTLAVLGEAPDTFAPPAGVEIVRTGLPLDWTAAGADALRATARGVARLARAAGADLVQLNSPALAADGDFDRPVLGVCHSCLATWWAAVRGGEPPADFRWRIAATARGYAACDRLIAPSAAFAEATAQAYGLRPKVVHNGRAAARGTPPVVSDAGRRSGVVATGRFWDAGKDAPTLDAMAARLDTPVRALGPCEGPPNERVQLAHVQAVGQVSSGEVRAALRDARVFVSTALYEPFGLGVLEAAQAGCALVLSDIEVFRELWDGVAVFAPPRDAARFARAVQALLDDPAEAARRGAAAQRRAARYDLAHMVQGMAEAYRALTASTPTRAGAPA